MNRLLTTIFLGWFGCVLPADAQIDDACLTIYNTQLTLVRQPIRAELHKGHNRLKISNLPASLDPASVRLLFPDINKKITLQEQRFRYDLRSKDQILTALIGTKIGCRLSSGGQVEGILLKHTRGNIILQLPDEHLRIIATDLVSDIDFPTDELDIAITPTLEWRFQSTYRGPAPATLVYTMEDLNWHTEYNLALTGDESHFSLSAWIQIVNRSETTFGNARIKLIAGDIHRAAGPIERPALAASKIAEVRPGISPQPLSDYYAYDLPEPVSLQSSEIKQVPLLQSAEGQGTKSYLYENSSEYAEFRRPLDIVFRFENSPANNLGIPLPAGKIRIYGRDSNQAEQLLGEDLIAHTSRNDTLELRIGKAFDLEAERVVRQRERVSKRSELVTVQITVYNRKESSVALELCEHLSGSWELKEGSHTYRRPSASRLVFPLEIAANHTVVVRYAYLRKW